jgi:glycosyltransferase involved in cell wall biosynthesis
MNIIITGTGFSFPNGTGAAARVMAFAKGFVHNGATVHVFSPKPTEINEGETQRLPVKGVYEGISFEYTCGQRFVAKTRVGALLLYLKGLFRAVWAIRRVHRETPVDAILLWYADSPLNFFVFKVMSKFIGAPLIAEICEFPFVYSRKSVSVRINLWFNEHVTYRLIDGVIVISTFLQKFFETHSGKSVKILYVPILVEFGMFSQDVRRVALAPARKIVYCGNLEHAGEVEALLRAFSQVSDEFPKWHIQVIGPLPQRRTEKTLHTMVVELGLEGRVDFTGAVSRSDIPCRLAAGDIMALPRASGVFSAAGCPTKLGEYLATGKPVVVTNTGDISKYLQDGVNAFLVPPDDTAAFARALRYVMLHPEDACVVGARGQKVAESEFNSDIHGVRIIEFVLSLRRLSDSSF